MRVRVARGRRALGASGGSDPHRRPVIHRPGAEPGCQAVRRYRATAPADPRYLHLPPLNIPVVCREAYRLTQKFTLEFETCLNALIYLENDTSKPY